MPLNRAEVEKHVRTHWFTPCDVDAPPAAVATTSDAPNDADKARSRSTREGNRGFLTVASSPASVDEGSGSRA